MAAIKNDVARCCCGTCTVWQDNFNRTDIGSSYFYQTGFAIQAGALRGQHIGQRFAKQMAGNNACGGHHYSFDLHCDGTAKVIIGGSGLADAMCAAIPNCWQGYIGADLFFNAQARTLETRSKWPNDQADRDAQENGLGGGVRQCSIPSPPWEVDLCVNSGYLDVTVNDLHILSTPCRAPTFAVSDTISVELDQGSFFTLDNLQVILEGKFIGKVAGCDCPQCGSQCWFPINHRDHADQLQLTMSGFRSSTHDLTQCQQCTDRNATFVLDRVTPPKTPPNNQLPNARYAGYFVDVCAVYYYYGSLGCDWRHLYALFGYARPTFPGGSHFRTAQVVFSKTELNLSTLTTFPDQIFSVGIPVSCGETGTMVLSRADEFNFGPAGWRPANGWLSTAGCLMDASNWTFTVV